MNPSIKICGLSTSETLEVALQCGADMVGFVFFDKSPRHIDLAQACTLGAQARGRAKIVALSVNADDVRHGAIVDAIRPDFLQLHGAESPQRVAQLRRRFDIPIIKAIGVSRAEDLAAVARYERVADWLLFDAKAPPGATRPGGNAIPFDWRLAHGIATSKPWMLSGGLDAENIAQAIALTSARCVDVSSGVESAPGVKDPIKIAAFIRSARSALAAKPAQRISA